MVSSVRLRRQRFQLASGGARFEFWQDSDISEIFCGFPHSCETDGDNVLNWETTFPATALISFCIVILCCQI